MKKLLLLVLIVLSFNVSKAQTAFVSPYSTISNKVDYYGLEVGLCYDKVWVSTDYSYDPTAENSYVGLNLYNKVASANKFGFWLYNSVGYDFSYKSVAYEPGGSVVFDLTKVISPQFTVSVPIIKNTSVAYTLSLMLNL